jgi:hypothetical protein
MYDIKVLNNKCKMRGGDVSPQCFVKDLLWVVNLVCKKEDPVYCWFKAHQPRQVNSLNLLKKSNNKNKTKKTNLPDGLWAWRGWWALNQQ